MIPDQRTRTAAVLLLLLLSGCASPVTTPDALPASPSPGIAALPTQLDIVTPAPTSTPDATATPIYIPSPPPLESPPPSSSMTDVLSTALSEERRAIGDSFTRSIFERPFTAEDMDYLPYLDIGPIVTLGLSADWVYVSIPLAAEPPMEQRAYYGVELDLNVDGRGDWLFFAPAPPTDEWTQSGLMIFIDSNVDVGGSYPASPDPSSEATDGYDARVFNQGEGFDRNAAWVRRDPANDAVIQFAFAHGLIANDRRFLWSVFASGAEIDPGAFELNDRMTLEEAGSPLLTSPHYPILAIARFDSTCRWSYGFTPLGTETGICGGSP